MSEKDNSQIENKQLMALVDGLLSHDDILKRCVMERDIIALKDQGEFRKCRSDVYPFIVWMGNLLTLCGAFLFCKFNQWRKDVGAHPTDKKRPNAIYLKRLLAGVQSIDYYFPKQCKPSAALRTLRVLDGLYDSFDMSFLIIKYIIINSQIEAGFNFLYGDEKRGLVRLLGFPDDENLRVSCNAASTSCDVTNKNNYKKSGYNLIEAFNLISAFRNDPLFENNYNTKSYKNVPNALNDVFTAMDFIKHVSLKIDSEGNINFIEKTENGEITIYSHGVVKLFNTKEGQLEGLYKSGMDVPKSNTIGFYLLESVDYAFEKDNINNTAVSFSYRSFDESNITTVYFPEKKEFISPENCNFIVHSEKSAAECYKRITGYLPGTRSTSSFFRGMLTTQFRFHNILTASIVDAIDKDREAKVRVLKEFVKKDKTSFKEALEPTFKTLEYALNEIFPDNWEEKVEKLCNYILNDKYKFRRIVDWDTLLARILIYEGSTGLLKTILLHDNKYDTKDRDTVEDICEQIITGLEMRYIDHVFEADDVSIEQKENYEKFSSRIEEIKKLYPGDFSAKIECKALAQSYIDTFIKTLTKIDKKKDETVNNKFAVYSIQDTIEILNNNEHSPNSENVFIQTIIAFLSFYAGIFSCCQSQMKYEFEKSISILSPDEIKDHQKYIRDDFFIGVSKKAVELAKILKDDYPIKKILEELWKFASMSVNDIKYYNAVLARPPINYVKLTKIFNIENGKIIFKDENEKSYDFDYVVNEDLLFKYLRKITVFLSGEDLSIKKYNEKKSNDMSNYTVYKEHARRVVYPQIVVFSKHREDGDANHCLIMDHSGALASWRDGEVQILTEFEYKINHAYYVLPNINRIETEWWVDPLMISCYEFDEEISKSIKN